MATGEKLSSRGQAWFCTTGLPSDVEVEVDDMNFHLHKFPLMSKSPKLHQLITEQEANHSSTSRTQTLAIPEAEFEEEEEEEEQQQHCHLTLANFPGGPETFELAAKFCYGVKTDLTVSNVVPLRCAGEFLEMCEEYSEDNLISKTERFLSKNVFNSVKNSIIALKSCQSVMPLAETLGITHRCIDSIISMLPSANPATFECPVSDSPSKQVLGRRSRRRNGASGGKENSWFEELSFLGLPLFKQLIHSMKGSELKPEIIETCLMYYAKKYIPGLSRSNQKHLTSPCSSLAEQRELVETVISNLPLEKTSNPSTSPRFLLGLLRTVNILKATEACRDVLEKKIGLHLEEATLDDLLIPSYSYLNETLYDVNCVARILGYFLQQEQNAGAINGDVPESTSLMLVGKLFDAYLAEIASDANLKPAKFYDLAISLPDRARLFDDGLYRAVDVYLKAHPWVSESEREKICGVLEWPKLTLEACTHAAQNERLPLRAVVQVLFFEQLHLRHAIAGTLMAAKEPERPPAALGGEEQEDRNGSDTCRVAMRDNQVLRFNMDSVRTRMNDLERECSSMKRVITKMEKSGPGPSSGARWAPLSLGRKFSCKFKTQVCDSHEQVVPDTRKGRPHHRPHRE